MDQKPSTPPDPIQREQALFAATLEHAPEERAAFLDGACHDDPELRQRLENLLTANDDPDSLLREDLTADATHGSPFHDEAVGQTLGRYKLLERVGEGGFGIVYVAEQTEPVRRRVALKVIKLGMDTKQVVARFEAERQALALMDHPNIAKVLDAGTTDQGRPYFVMELVRGIKITDYCDQEKMSTKDRLDLFIKACHAIQHAHQKGIIHRDIKPSNILVTLHDGVPIPKVIDFGIAKATEGRLTDATVYTQLHQFIGTPAYMSPEQAEMSGLDIDTRSDIYSLGVLLYELLTGKTPFDGKELVSMGIDAMRKTIREREPARPSTKLATLDGAELTTTATLRASDAAKLAHLLRGDLDWIIMKCLEKDRQRRYETSNGLAADILRHLNNEPVLARPPSAAYKFQKAWRRNKVVFTAAALVILALLSGLTIAAVGLKKAIVARQEAQANEARAIEAQDSEAQLRLQAERDELAARQRAYASDMNVAKQALDANNLGRALDLLNRQRPAPDHKDLRGWEWRYLWQQTRSDAVATLCQEVSEINAISCTPDGSLLALGLRHQGGVSVWDLRSRKELVRLVEGSSYVRTAFSPSGSLLAIFSERTSPSKERVVSLQVWNVATRMIMTEVPLAGRITCLGMAFANDGKTLITSTIGDGSDLEAIMTGEITLWNMPDGEKIAQFPAVDQRGIDPGTSFAANSDLSTVAHGSSVGMLRVLDLTTGKERWKVDTGSELILSLAFSPDGKILACGNGFSNPQLTLWDVKTGRLLGRLEGHQSWVSSMVFLSNGQTMATSSADQTIRIWDLASHSCLSVLRGHRQEVWRLALLPDERTLISGAKDGTVCLWDLAHPPISRGRITLPVNTLSWGYSEDGRSIVTLNDSGRVESWTAPDLSQREQIMEIGPVTANKFYLNQFSPDGKWLAAGSSRGLIRLWDLESRSVVRELHHSNGDTQVMNFLPARNKVVTLSWQDEQLHEWDLDSGEETQVWTAAPGVSFDACGASPDGRFQVTIGYGGDTVLRDLLNQKTLQAPSLALEAGPASFSPSGDLVAVSSDLGHTKVWNTGDWQEVTTLGGVLNAMMSVTFSPDATRIATSGGDDEAVKLFDTESWQDVLTLKSPGIGLRGVKISPDGNTITMGSSTGMISVWHAPTWEEIKATESRE